MPSSRRHTCAIAAIVSSSSAVSGRTSLARETNRLTASVARAMSGRSPTRGSASDPTAMIRSPARPKPSRLVATTTTSGQLLTSASANVAAASSTCSQLSSTNNNCRLAKRLSDRRRPTHRQPRFDTHNVRQPAGRPRPTTSTVRAHTTTRHGGNRGCASAANWSANRVFPAPPTPVSVTIRADSTASRTLRNSASRPTNSVTCVGKFPGKFEPDRNGGKLTDRRAATPAPADSDHEADAHRDRASRPRERLPTAVAR